MHWRRGSVGSFNLPSPSRSLILPCWCRAGYLKHKEAASRPLFGDCSLFLPTSPPIHFFSLLSKCCPIATLSLFLTFTLEPKCSGPFHYVNEKRCREGEHCHRSLPFAFHLRHTHFRAVSHNHFWSIQHNHSGRQRVILSQSISTRSMDSQVWRSLTRHFEPINVTWHY